MSGLVSALFWLIFFIIIYWFLMDCFGLICNDSYVTKFIIYHDLRYILFIWFLTIHGVMVRHIFLCGVIILISMIIIISFDVR